MRSRQERSIALAVDSSLRGFRAILNQLVGDLTSGVAPSISCSDLMYPSLGSIWAPCLTGGMSGKEAYKS